MFPGAVLDQVKNLFGRKYLIQLTLILAHSPEYNLATRYFLSEIDYPSMPRKKEVNRYRRNPKGIHLYFFGRL
ncbi:hypothetical protein JTB14_004231 [Gonioctena quinquepunctata]|nr:hypothetical protein JTB14_004231 [Gonioctena quinquepunctata]